MRKHKTWIIITSLITLLPMLAGVLLWDRLPEQMPTHWNVAGEIDGWSSRSFAVFGLPALLLGVHLLCVFATLSDPKNQDNNVKYFRLVLWISPVVSVLVNGLVYCAALGLEFSMEQIMPIFIGALFIVLGNWMPKLKQNYTIGIKVPWVYYDEEIWNKTHRLGGKLWVATGVVILIAGLFNWFWAMLIALIPAAVVPIVYSYWLYQKKYGKKQ